MIAVRRALLLALAAGLAACGEPSQELAAGQKRADRPAWASEASPFAAPGWQGKDQASWEQQIRSRNQGQNEYARVSQ